MIAVRIPFLGIVSFLLLALWPAGGQRLPVLRQMDVPYRIYPQEMYLPQLTSGPSSAAWMPDSQSVIFSMQGSLWRQDLRSTTAEQLTDGPGYDYQPDVSSDGRWVVYSKYDHDTIELWLLDLLTQKSKQLTRTDAINLEARWSPAFKSGDTRVMFVSTQLNRRFHIFVAQFDPATAELKEVQRLTAETLSPLPRRFDSAYDHEISPTWSPDGKETIFVSNHNRVEGAGGFWRMKSIPLLVEAPPPVARGPFGMMARRLPPIVKEESHQIHDEETTWRARPDWSPDGKRVIYASYLASGIAGRHQLKIMTSEGADAVSLSRTQGDYDDIYPRWSPDSKSIAFISNRGGNLSLWIENLSDGSQQQLVQKERRFLAPTASIRLQGGEAGGAIGPVRVSITAADGRAYAPDDALMNADDSVDRKERPFEDHYFYLNVSRLRPSVPITVPAGKIHLEIAHGLEHLPVSLDLDLKAGESRTIPFRLPALHLPGQLGSRWIAGDIHVSTNYGGLYHTSPLTLLTQMEAEGLSLAYHLLTTNADVDRQLPVTRTVGAAAKAGPQVALMLNHHIFYGKAIHSTYWGDFGFLSPSLPDVSGGRHDTPYPDSASVVTGFFPTNAGFADLAHSKNSLAGYIQNFREVPGSGSEEGMPHGVPVDIALDKVDYYPVLDSRDPISSAEVWYKFLNLGFRIPAAAGSDAVPNYSQSRGPVGLDRVYVQVPRGPFRINPWLSGLKRGHSFVTNGPLLNFTLGGENPGGEVKLSAPRRVKFTVTLRSIVPVDHLEVICNGKVAITIPMNKAHDSSNAAGSVRLPRSGWCLLRAWAEKTEDPVLESYPYATTSPIYVTVAGAKPGSSGDAIYFMSWIDDMTNKVNTSPELKNDAQKAEILKTLRDARAVYEKLQ